MAENNSSAPLKTAGEPFVALGECIADQVCLRVAELPDRDSPADWPQAMLVTSDELRNIVLNAINYAAQAVAAQAAPAAVGVSAKKLASLVEELRMLAAVQEPEYPNFQIVIEEAAKVLENATPALPATEDSSAGDLAEVHPDDAAVDALAAKMKAKLAKQRAKGYGGWNTQECSQQRLSDMLRDHVAKGDPVDVANFCAFLVARGEGIQAEVQPKTAELPKGVAQFTKKPVTINAIQWDGKNLYEVISFTQGVPNTRSERAQDAWDDYAKIVEREGLHIDTLEGKMLANVGDWIIRGVKGEHYPCKPDIFAATYETATAPQAQPADALDAEIAKLKKTCKELGNMFHDQIVAQQAAWIEWQHGAGAEAGMQWIENGLCGPGHIPDEGEPYGTEAQAYFDANKSDPFPACYCGRPSNILWMGKGFCSDAHHDEHRAAMAAAQEGGKA